MLSVLGTVQEAVYSGPDRGSTGVEFTFQSRFRWWVEGQSDFQKTHVCVSL